MTEHAVDQLAIVRMLRDQKAALTAEVEALKGGNGGGTSSTVTDEPLSKRVDLLQALILSLGGIVIAGFFALAALSFNTSSNANGRIDKLSDNLSSLNREVGALSSKVDSTNSHLDRVDAKLDRNDAKLDAIIAKIGATPAK